MFNPPFETRAMVHSKNSMDTVTIIHFNNNNNAIAKYHGCLYSAVFNPFTWLFYVDDVYGYIREDNEETSYEKSSIN